MAQTKRSAPESDLSDSGPAPLTELGQVGVLRNGQRGALRASLSQTTYETLRVKIVSGLLRPNERLVEGDLSQKLGVSRTPIRDALMRLSVEGLIDGGKRGWSVHEFSRQELQDIYETRVALEGYAAGLVATRATDQQIAEMTELLEAERRDLDSGSTETVEKNAEFHRTVVSACGNPRLIALVELNRDFYFSRRVLPFYTREDLEHSLAEHFELLNAIRAHKAKVAEGVVRRHLLGALDILMRTAH